MVKHFLDDSNVDSVSGASSTIGGQRDENMFFDGEGSWVEATMREDGSKEATDWVR
jgi:hypothetical protein